MVLTDSRHATDTACNGAATADIGPPDWRKFLLRRTTQFRDLAVIVVDDDPDVRTMLRTLLELDDREVIEAADGEQAWKMILQYRPAIVVTDLQMPCLDGLALCRRNRDNRFRDVKVIVYTGCPVTAEDVKRAGAHEHFLKTDPLGSLRQTITRLASWHSGPPIPRPNSARTSTTRFLRLPGLPNHGSRSSLGPRAADFGLRPRARVPEHLPACSRYC